MTNKPFELLIPCLCKGKNNNKTKTKNKQKEVIWATLLETDCKASTGMGIFDSWEYIIIFQESRVSAYIILFMNTFQGLMGWKFLSVMNKSNHFLHDFCRKKFL